MKIFNSIKNFFRRLSFKIRAFFYFKYIGIYEVITLKLLATVSQMTRKLIIAKGKDPDYVAPPPAPAPTIVEVVAEKPRPQINIPYVPAWVKASFKNSSVHPVNQSRANLKLNPNPNPYDLIGSKVPEKSPEVETLQVTLDTSTPFEVLEPEVVFGPTNVGEPDELILESDTDNKELH